MKFIAFIFVFIAIVKGKSRKLPGELANYHEAYEGQQFTPYQSILSKDNGAHKIYPVFIVIYQANH